MGGRTENYFGLNEKQKKRQVGCFWAEQIQVQNGSFFRSPFNSFQPLDSKILGTKGTGGGEENLKIKQSKESTQKARKRSKHKTDDFLEIIQILKLIQLKVENLLITEKETNLKHKKLKTIVWV